VIGTRRRKKAIRTMERKRKWKKNIKERGNKKENKTRMKEGTCKNKIRRILKNK
jgi:hypothetical protein